MQVEKQQLEPNMEHRLVWERGESKTAGRNINNLRYADYTTHMAESEEKQKNFLMKVKEWSEKLA